MKQRLINANALMEYCLNQKEKTIDCNDIARFPTACNMGTWIPIKTRPLTEEEKERYSNLLIEFEYDCPLPENGQDVLVTDCYGNVELDTFCRDCNDDCYFENNCDDGDVVAWMPLPEPYKADSEGVSECTKVL